MSNDEPFFTKKNTNEAPFWTQLHPSEGREDEMQKILKRIQKAQKEASAKCFDVLNKKK